MLTIASNPLRFHIVNVFLKGKTFSVTHYIKHILEQILALCPKSWRYRLVIHADNVSPYIAWRSQSFGDSNSFRIVIHLTYSKNLALTKFYLFEYLKYYLNGNSCPSEETFLLGIHTIFMQSHKPLWRMCPGTWWTDWFGSPDTKVITTIKSNSGLFALIKFCLGTEMLYLHETLYISRVREFIQWFATRPILNIYEIYWDPLPENILSVFLTYFDFHNSFTFRVIRFS
jgi:hypothetical protein